MSRTLSTKGYLALVLGLQFVILSVVVVVLVNSTMKRLALSEAEQASRMLLDHNLAIHTYFSQDLKPKLFERLSPKTSKDYFEPVWMSSTYAVRKMDGYFRHFNQSPYYYKECAINARSPENEADDYEKTFLVDLQNSPQLTTKSAIRFLDGKPYFTFLRRGEAMEESCLRCHSSPEQAPGDLVRQYGSDRSFHRKVEDVAQAISIRIPLSEAFSSVGRFSAYLSGLLLFALGGGFLFVWVGTKRYLIGPMAKIQEQAMQIASEPESLGETIPAPKVRELRDLVTSFNQMSVELRKTYDELEQRVLERTKDLSDANQQLEREIEDRKKAQDALRENDFWMQSLFNALEEAVLVVTPDRCLRDINPAAERIFGYTKDEVRGHSTEVFHVGHDHYLEFGRRIQLAFDKGESARFEFEARRKNSEIFPTEHTVSLLRDPSGEAIGIVSVVGDTTDRKRAKEALRESEERFRLSAESLSDVIYEWDLGSSVKWFGNIDGLLGYAPGEFPNTLEAWIGILHPDDRDRVWKAVEKQLSDEATYDIEYRAQHKEGGWRYWVARGTVLKDTSGKPLRWIGAVTDITDRKRAEELALQSARLRAVADLSSGVAHHFNNLLQIVIGNTSLSLADLESGDLSEIKTNLEQMLGAATLGVETVKRLQTFANMRADVSESESDVFDVATTAGSAAEAAKPLWKSDPEKRGIKIDLQLNLEDGCLVKGHENEMFEVLVNLIRNGAEAMPQGGDIEVKAYREADEVVITVRDTGTGIAEEDRSKVFQPFWSSKGVGIGKGMGLAVTHGLVKRHGGTISVQTQVGAGTTFTIRLPLVQEPVRKTEEPAMRPAEGKLTILVIDDDLNIASLLERILAKAGHRVFKALSGQEGLAIFNKEPVDLVICDLGMPGMSGWDVGKAIRSLCRDRGITKPPFILLTGWGGQELERKKIAESGTDAVVAKPIDSATVIATVQEITARGRG